MILAPDTVELSAYLQPSEVVNWCDPAVLELGQRITSERAPAVEKASAIYAWVQAEIPHSVDVGREEVTCSASEVLTLRTGICYGQSHLFAALLRAVSIPAGFAYQIADAQGSLHGFVGALLNDAWIALDARGRAPFAAAGVLAWPDDPLLDGLVYAEPLPRVVDALRTYDTVSELCAHLPTQAGMSLGNNLRAQS